MDIVRLSVPGTLLYRDVVLRVVASMCRLTRLSAEKEEQEPGHRDASPRHSDFDDKVVSAVGEAFNNVAIHAYAGVSGYAELELVVALDTLTVRISDAGAGFDLPSQQGEGLETLRESHMGLEIMVACMDEVTYVRGSGTSTPNVLTMKKRYLTNAPAPTGEA